MDGNKKISTDNEFDIRKKPIRLPHFRRIANERLDQHRSVKMSHKTEKFPTNPTGYIYHPVEKSIECAGCPKQFTQTTKCSNTACRCDPCRCTEPCLCTPEITTKNIQCGNSECTCDPCQCPDPCLCTSKCSNSLCRCDPCKCSPPCLCGINKNISIINFGATHIDTSLEIDENQNSNHIFAMLKPFRGRSTIIDAHSEIDPFWVLKSNIDNDELSQVSLSIPKSTNNAKEIYHPNVTIYFPDGLEYEAGDISSFGLTFILGEIRYNNTSSIYFKESYVRITVPLTVTNGLVHVPQGTVLQGYGNDKYDWNSEWSHLGVIVTSSDATGSPLTVSVKPIDTNLYNIIADFTCYLGIIV